MCFFAKKETGMKKKHYVFKRIFSFVMAVTLLFSMTACGNSTDDSINADAGEQASEELHLENSLFSIDIPEEFKGTYIGYVSDTEIYLADKVTR